MTWPIAPNIATHFDSSPDTFLQAWTLDWDARALLSDPAHLFNAPMFYPYTNSVAFTESLIGQAIFVAPVLWLTHNPVLAFNVLLLASFILCGWGMALLAKDVTGRWSAAIVAGLIFAYFPNRFAQLSHINIIAAQYLPFALLCARILLRNTGRRRWLFTLLFGLCLALQILSGTYLGFFSLVAIGLYGLYRAVAAVAVWWPTRKAVRLAFGGALLYIGGIALAVLLCLPFLLPYLALNRELGLERVIQEVTNWSAEPYFFLSLPRTNILNDALYSRILDRGLWPPVNSGERLLYPGAVAAALGLLGALVVVAGLWQARRNRAAGVDGDGLFFVLLVVAGVALCFGPGKPGGIPLPYRLLYEYVPGFGALRVPVRFIYITMAGLAVLAALGVAWLQDRVARRISRPSFRQRAPLILTTLVAGLILLEYATRITGQTDAGAKPPSPEYGWLAQHPAPTLFLPPSNSAGTDLSVPYGSLRANNTAPVMNGSSGFFPPVYNQFYQDFVSSLPNFPSARTLALLQGLEVKYLVIHASDSRIAPKWAQLRAYLAAQPALSLVQSFGDSYIYSITPDRWLRDLPQNAGIRQGDKLYWLAYNRGDPQLLELAAYYLHREDVSALRWSDSYGNILIGYRALSAPPSGGSLGTIIVAAGENPALFGYTRDERVWHNSVVDVYKPAPGIARFDWVAPGRGSTPQAATTMLLSLNHTNGQIVATGAGGTYTTTIAPSPTYDVEIGLAATASYTVGAIGANAGVSVYRQRVNDGAALLSLPVTDGAPTLLWANVRPSAESGTSAPTLSAQNDAVVVQTAAHMGGAVGRSAAGLVLDMQIATPPNIAKGYSATLDVYVRPWGTHPAGHFGYWALPVPATGTNAAPRLSLTLDPLSKMVAATRDAAPTDAYPPPVKDLNMEQSAKFGDFRATLNVYAGGQLLGVLPAYDFSVADTGGGKTDPARRTLLDFTPSPARVYIMPVLPAAK